AGCLAAKVMKTNVALAPLVDIIDKHKGVRAAWNGLAQEEREKQAPYMQLYETAHGALHGTPFNNADGPPLLRLARIGEMESWITERLLRAGPARWHVWRRLREDAAKLTDIRTLDVLHALDARAAYEPLKKYLAAGEKLNYANRLLREYNTAWVQRFALE